MHRKTGAWPGRRAEEARSGRLVVVAENHTEIGGLGEAVAGTLMHGMTVVTRNVAAFKAGDVPLFDPWRG